MRDQYVSKFNHISKCFRYLRVYPRCALVKASCAAMPSTAVAPSTKFKMPSILKFWESRTEIGFLSCLSETSAISSKSKSVVKEGYKQMVSAPSVYHEKKDSGSNNNNGGNNNNNWNLIYCIGFFQNCKSCKYQCLNTLLSLNWYRIFKIFIMILLCS